MWKGVSMGHSDLGVICFVILEVGSVEIARGLGCLPGGGLGWFGGVVSALVVGEARV